MRVIVATVAGVFDGRGPEVHPRVRSGSPAAQYDAGLVVVVAGGRGLSESAARR